MRVKCTVTFSPNGTGHCLYTDAIDLGQIGVLQIERATRIDYDNTKGAWRVYDIGDDFPMFSAPTRAQCLEWERLHLESLEDQKHELQYGPDPVAVGA